MMTNAKILVQRKEALPLLTSGLKRFGLYHVHGPCPGQHSIHFVALMG